MTIVYLSVSLSLIKMLSLADSISYNFYIHWQGNFENLMLFQGPLFILIYNCSSFFCFQQVALQKQENVAVCIFELMLSSFMNFFYECFLISY